MNRKISLRIVLTLALTLAVFAALNVFAYAASITAEIGTISIDLNETEPVDGGYIVNVPITITENSGFLTVGMEVTYPAEFTLTGWTEGTVFPATANMTSTNTDDFNLNPFTVMYFTYEANITETGNLITLNFKVPADIELGEYEFLCFPPW